MMLGAAIAFFIVVLAGGPEPAASFPALLWICAVPAIDTLSLIVRRLRADQSPLAADRRHLHHLLLDAGFSPWSATAVIVALCFSLGAIGVGGSYVGVSDAVMAFVLLVPLAIHTLFVCSRPATVRAAVAVERPAGIFSSPSIKDGNP
jgi:UDP-GlcNAc:undecaprenyl-phosphate GlcNAc-1-phosphate transferase